MKALIATQNQGKISAAQQALNLYFEEVFIEKVDISSDVSIQPINEEIQEGVQNRIKNLKRYCQEKKITVDYFMAVESGLVQLYGNWYIMNIAAISDNSKKISFGISPSYPVPKKYVKKIQETDLSTLFNEIYGNDKNRANQKGGIDRLTHGAIDRINQTFMAFTMALTEWINEEWQDEE